MLAAAAAALALAASATSVAARISEPHDSSLVLLGRRSTDDWLPYSNTASSKDMYMTSYSMTPAEDANPDNWDCEEVVEFPADQWECELSDMSKIDFNEFECWEETDFSGMDCTETTGEFECDEDDEADHKVTPTPMPGPETPASTPSTPNSTPSMPSDPSTPGSTGSTGSGSGSGSSGSTDSGSAGSTSATNGSNDPNAPSAPIKSAAQPLTPFKSFTMVITAVLSAGLLLL
ncbi:hypothetical protein HK105_208106 [Polyrhizophydium stewartii]|uniref:Uncharacterized protein n=1 Tax=Polyrhizophydium stewartii TaxID=2732419 RepID=A0ABR4MYN6_9FUNG